MNPNPLSIEELIADESFQSYCLEEDAAAMKKWQKYLEQHPEQKSAFEEARAIIKMLQLQLSDQEIEEEKNSFFLALEKQNKYKTLTRRKWIFSVAAACFAIALGAFFFFSKTPVVLAVHQSSDTVKEVSLPDGSTLFLDKNSTVRFAESWKAKENRQVWLDGKAFFQVSKTPVQGNEKFIVHTNLGDVQVLGTSFVLDSRMESFEVVLETGKLSFSDLNAGITFLQPGERVFLKAGKIILEKTNGTNYSIWKEKEIKFENTTIAEIVASFRASYQLNIIVLEKNLLDRKVTATIPVNDYQLFFNALSEIYDITIVQEDNKIIMK